MKLTKKLAALLLALVMILSLGVTVYAEEDVEMSEEDEKVFIGNWNSWGITSFDPDAFAEPEGFWFYSDPDPLPGRDDMKLYEKFMLNDFETNMILSVQEDNVFELFALSDLFTGTWEDDGEKYILKFDDDEEEAEFFLEYHVNGNLFLSDSERTWQFQLSSSYESASETYEWEHLWDEETGVYTTVNEKLEKNITPMSDELFDALSEMEEADVDELFKDRYEFEIRPFLGKWIATGIEFPYGKLTIVDEDGKEATFFQDFTLTVDYTKWSYFMNVGSESTGFLSVEDENNATISWTTQDGTVKLEDDVLTLTIGDTVFTYQPADYFEN